MEPQDQKTIDRLVRAVEMAYNSPGRVFWRGFLWGLGRGLGYVVGVLILIAILYYLFKASGLAQTFKDVYQTFRDLSSVLSKLNLR